jgi:2-oxoglutarate ferredoxin oxidoreductase subunit gamma
MRDARIEIRIGGTGGQGLILCAKTYEPTSRGGFCNSDLVISTGDVDFPLATAVDYLVLLDRLALKPSWPLLKPGALVIADTRLCPELPTSGYRAHHLPLSRTAIELGSERVANIVALGALAALSGLCERKALERAVHAETPKSFLDLNLDALAAGYRLGEQATKAQSPATAG